mmetsp:Transcript_29162/g.58248  ORF Transcript_29162/g.58248 Transcript_29162/m.58248 type:complete len:1101 (-) Transcript_29162:54-3356(-)
MTSQVERLTFKCTAPLQLGHSLHVTVPTNSHNITPLVPPPPISASTTGTIELHTTPDTYPVWTTTVPVVKGSCSSGPKPLNYRYCVKTTDGAGVKWEGEEISEHGGVVAEAGDEGILPESRSGRVGRRVVKYRSVAGARDDSGVITDAFEDGFDGPEYDESTKAWRELYAKPQKQRSNEGAGRIDFISDEEISRGEETSDRKSALFLICYHLPIQLWRDSGGAWRGKWQNSLLAKTDGSVADAVPTFWIGGVKIPGLTPSDERDIKAVCEAMNAHPIFIPQELHEHSYLGMCKQVLWPFFHNIDMLDVSTSGFGDNPAVEEARPGDAPSIWDQSRLHKKWWESYQRVNMMFADLASSVMRPGDTAWVHDYHLAILPKLLEKRQVREAGRRTTSTIFFLHIPFPTSQVFRELECGEWILEGMLSADVVGFHAFDHARHFLNASKRLMGLNYESKFGGLIGLQYRGRTVMVSTSHVSIEPTVMTATMKHSAALGVRDGIRSLHSGRQVLGGVDVAQKLSGVALKFLAYEKLLEDYPVWQRKLVLVQRVLTPRNRTKDEDQTLRHVRTIVRRIEAKHGAGCIDYKEAEGSELPVAERVGLWMATDVYFNSTIREGLNLGPLEYVYCRGGGVPGVVVCSEFSAACNILNGALRINPFDVQQTSAVLDKALKMGLDEKEKRRGRDIDFVSQRTASQWSRHVLRDLKEAVAASKEEDAGNVVSEGELLSFSHVNVMNLVSAFRSSSERVIICDYGGTLLSKEAPGKYLKRDISATSGRKPRPDVMSSLERLCEDPRNTVFVVSGVNRRELEGSLGSIPRIGLAASNGACFSWPSTAEDGAREWHAFQFGVDWEDVKAVAIPIMSKYAARTNGSSLKILDLSISWSYFSADPEWGAIQAKFIVPELQDKLKAFDVQVVMLKGQVEIVPKLLHKGVLVKRLLRELAAKNKKYPQFTMVVGDDKSDEPMFAASFDFLAEQVDPDFVAASSPSLPVALVTGGSGSFDSSDSKPPTRSPTPTLGRRLSHDTNLVLPPFKAESQYAYTITVGRKASNATEFLHNAREVEDLLVALAMADEGEHNKDIKKRLSTLSTESWDDQHTIDSSFYDI